MNLTCAWVNQLAIKAADAGGMQAIAREELVKISKATPKTNGESDAVRLAGRIVSGGFSAIEVAAANQPNPKKQKNRRR